MKSYFESTAQRKDFFTFLKRGFVPLKYAYVGSAARTHQLLALGKDYRHAVINSAKQKYLGKLFQGKKMNVIEIGPGIGTSSLQILTDFQHNHINVEQYVGLDFSKSLLELSERNIRNSFPTIPITLYQCDIEEDANVLLKKDLAKFRGTNIVFMVGNTLGNVENPTKTLANVFNLLRKKDYFVCEIALFTNTTYNYAQDYQNKTFFDACLEPFKMAGIWSEHDILEITFEIESQAIVGYYYPAKDFLVREGKMEFILKAGSKIRCFLSRRFMAKGIENLLAHAGFTIISNEVSKSGMILTSISRK